MTTKTMPDKSLFGVHSLPEILAVTAALGVALFVRQILDEFNKIDTTQPGVVLIFTRRLAIIRALLQLVVNVSGCMSGGWFAAAVVIAAGLPGWEFPATALGGFLGWRLFAAVETAFWLKWGEYLGAKKQ